MEVVAKLHPLLKEYKSGIKEIPNGIVVTLPASYKGRRILINYDDELESRDNTRYESFDKGKRDDRNFRL